ncbi:hypothetical protein E4U28_007158 [Claviceps purpurea]|nr:hypothetical protein E4U28_007158 [Claviceps purpurea]
MTLLSGAVPPKKRKGMPLSEMLDDQLPEAVPLVREKLVKQNARALSEIWGREGLGPIDWKALASRISVPISLMDLWQISPELSKQFRKLSSRHRGGSKLFGVPALLFTGYKQKQVFDLSPGQAVADQGAEINIISRNFVLENKIPVYDLGTVD